ncbi:MAG: GIY-YIG nuclease family protein [Candidatus Yanofskybacteria bacterium]|nr:GIY-YIG nuclease family protein [Candidatus Yanofskybacteria bacterium]
MEINLKTIPKTAGVYFFRDKHGNLYIGKAVNLKNRISSYFNKQPKDPRISKMLEMAEKATFKKTDSEIEALILESQLIKKYKPPFNVMLRDDKQYFYVGFTKEKFPKIFLSHQIQNIGPFTDGNALKVAMRLLRRLFPYCTCGQAHNNFCLNYHIGNCIGFCCLKSQNPESKKQNLELYNKNIKAIKEILTGKRDVLIKKLKKEMLGLGKKHDFEKAIEFRNKIQKLEKVFENAQVLLNSKYTILNTKKGWKLNNPFAELQNVLNLPHQPKRIEGYDVSNIQGKFATGAMVVFINGHPDKSQYRKFKVGSESVPNDIAMLKEILTRRFNHSKWPYPDLIIVDGGKAQLNIAAKIIYGHRKTIDLAMTQNQIPIIALTKNVKHRGDHIYTTNPIKLSANNYGTSKKTAMPLEKLPKSVKNLILQIDSEAHRFAVSYYRKLHLESAK